MDRKEMDGLLRLMRRHGVAEFELDESAPGVKLTVRFAGAAGLSAPVVAVAPAIASPAAASPAAGSTAPDAGGRTVRAPIVGTFYRSPAPDKPSYVEVGTRVNKGQVVCIVEAMKLMNQIESDIDGVVAEILVENGAPVQFGQELFRLTQG